MQCFAVRCPRMLISLSSRVQEGNYLSRLISHVTSIPNHMSWSVLGAAVAAVTRR